MLSQTVAVVDFHYICKIWQCMKEEQNVSSQCENAEEEWGKKKEWINLKLNF
jgi:hypothetical protein